MLQIALTAFATFFVTVMPFKAAPFFATLTGPATITAVLVLISAHPDSMLAQAVVLAMLLLVLALTLALLLLAYWLERVIGITALGIMSRVAGILLAALAAEMILQGISQSGAFHARGR